MDTVDDQDSRSRDPSPEAAENGEYRVKKKKKFWKFGSLRKKLGGKRKNGGGSAPEATSRSPSVASFDDVDPGHSAHVPVLSGSPPSRRRQLIQGKSNSVDFVDSRPSVLRRELEMASYSDESKRHSWQPGRTIKHQRTIESQDSADFVATLERPNANRLSPQPQITITDTDVDELLGAAGTENEMKVEKRKPRTGQHYEMTVLLIGGRSLAIRDRSGKSDPYVKMKMGKQRKKSSTIHKNLNPNWNEDFTFFVSDVDDPLKVKVYDYDFGLRDDFMGSAWIDLSDLEVGIPNDLEIPLEDEDVTDEELGYLRMSITLTPLGKEGAPRALSRPSSVCEIGHKKLKRVKSGDFHALSKRHKSQLWKGVLNVVLLNGKHLPAMDDNGFSDPYCKFRLGHEKYKSKVISKTLNPEWKEQFDLHIFDGQKQLLEIEVWDRDYGAKDDFIGRCKVDVEELDPDKTHHKTLDLSSSGKITLMLTVSGTTEALAEEETDLFNEDEKKKLTRIYGPLRTLRGLSDIGHLRVKVIKAIGLQAADYGGTSDPFAVLELGNARVRTQTVYKTLDPEWGKVFSMKIKDIHSVLEITIFDEDRHRNEFLGRAVIPLLSVLPGEKRWYQLKDRKLKGTVKGQLQLEMDLVYNPIRASIRTFNPREENMLAEEEKFKRQVLTRNIQRVANIVRSIMAFWGWVQSLWEWRNPSRSFLSFVVFLVTVYFFDWWMPFVLLILIFLYQYFVTGKHKKFVIAPGSLSSVAEYSTDQHGHTEQESDSDSDEESDSKPKDEKKSLKQKYQAILDVCLNVQTITDWIACLGERIKKYPEVSSLSKKTYGFLSTFTWTIPFQSFLAIFVLTVVAILFALVPPRYVVLVWGINKFTKHLRKPNFIPNNELLDFLSRLPSDTEISQWGGQKSSHSKKRAKRK
eukprot:m.19761 g.19761  ORF g.19761 m.19761 type:complete len:916 (+) comp27899_c0_seq1:156-2903(+)